MPECVNFVEWELYTFFQKIRVVKNIPQANPKNSNKEHLLMTSLLDLFILNTSLRRVDLTGGVYLFLMLLHQVGNQLIFAPHHRSSTHSVHHPSPHWRAAHLPGADHWWCRCHRLSLQRQNFLERPGAWLMLHSRPRLSGPLLPRRCLNQQCHPCWTGHSLAPWFKFRATGQ